MNKEDRKYSFIAIVMVLFITGTLCMTEQTTTISLWGSLLFCLICSAVLLYCLMKLNVMDFQENSFWYYLNQKVSPGFREGFMNKYYERQEGHYMVLWQRCVKNSSSYRNIA